MSVLFVLNKTVFCMVQKKRRVLPTQHKIFRFYNKFLTLYSRVVTICTTSFSLHNSMFCSHSEFLLLLYMPEQTTFNSIHGVDWLVFKNRIKEGFLLLITWFFKYIACCIYLRRNRDLCHLLLQLIVYYKLDETFYCAVRTVSLNKAVYCIYLRTNSE